MSYTRDSQSFDLSDFETPKLELQVNFEQLVQLESRVLYSNEEIVKTISPFWLHISTLREAYKFNDDYVENIKELSKKYAGWKRVRGDGNCYYRSVISTFFLKIFHFNQNANRIFAFIQKIFQIEQIPELYKSDIEYIRQIIKDLYSSINNQVFQSKVKVFQQVLELLQDKVFDEKLILFARVLSYCTLIGEDGADVRGFLVDGDLEMTINHILELGKEAEGVELSLLPLALGIEVIQINLLHGKIVTSSFPETSRDQFKLKINIISKSQGHYDALYSIQDMEDDDYNMKLGKYMVPISN